MTLINTLEKKGQNNIMKEVGKVVKPHGFL